LTCDFWAENAKNNCKSRNNSKKKDTQWSLRPSASLLAWAERERLGAASVEMTILLIENHRRKNRKQVAKGPDGSGESSSSGSFAALRMTAKNKQGQVQPQVLRLRCSPSAVSNFAQDDKVL
jgi:hypothetical protein